jgi:hypothetical protein
MDISYMAVGFILPRKMKMENDAQLIMDLFPCTLSTANTHNPSYNCMDYSMH